MELNNKEILIVDDDPAILEMISDGLNEHDFKVITAYSPEEVNKKIKNQDIGLALLDFDLGWKKKNGIQLGIDLLDVYPDLIVVIMTGYHNIKYAIEALRKYSFHYMIKPFRIDQIISLFERAVHELQLRKENQLLKEQVLILKDENQKLRELIKDIRPEEANLSVAAKEKELRQRLKNQQAINSYRRQKNSLPFPPKE
ncbi:MAG: response regulator [Calditrichaeota bacterium]|nr:response regulator [Calditrichota bacterium]